MMCEILLPDRLHGLDGFGLQGRIGLVSGSGVVELEKIGGAEGLAVKKLEGTPLPRAVDQSGARVGSAAKCGIVVVAQAQIQNQIFAQVNLVLRVKGKYF